MQDQEQNDVWATLRAARAKVEALLNPKNIVIMGATDKPGNWPQRVWRNLARYNFPGPVYPFNPGRTEVWDTICYRSFDELPERPDHDQVKNLMAAFSPHRSLATMHLWTSLKEPA